MLGLIGFFLAFISYLMYIPEAAGKFPILLGMITVTSGYILLFAREVYVVSQKKEDVKDPRVKKVAKSIQLAGYALLATFFFVMHLIPQITFRVRFYDVFAAIGYLVGIFTKDGYVPLWMSYGPLVVYYVLAGGVKLFERGIVEKIQMVARALLAVYYARLLLAVAH